MTYVAPNSWTDFVSEITAAKLNQDLRDNILYLKEHEVPTGGILEFAGISAPTGYLFCDGSAISRLTYADLFAALSKTATVTITIATPGVVTWNAHGLRNGMPIRLTTTGALPTGLVAGTTYYIVNKSTNTFQLSATVDGSAINTSGSQSGTHTALCAPYGYGNGSTTFNVPDLQGRVPLGAGAGSGLTARYLGETGGAESKTLAEANLPAHTHSNNHTHTIPIDSATGSNPASASGGAGGTAGDVTSSAGGSTTGSTGSGQSFSIMPAYCGVGFIIKT